MNHDDLREYQNLHSKQQAYRREQAVRLLSERNHLRKLKLEADAGRKLTQAEEDALLLLAPRLEEVDQTIDRIKATMRSEEERIRQKTAEVLRLKIEWRHRQLFGQLPGTVNQDDSAFRAMAIFVITLMLIGLVLSLLSWLR